MASSKPLFLGPAVTGATFTLAEGLVLTLAPATAAAAAGTLAFTTPQLILGGLAAKTLALQGLVLASLAQDQKQDQKQTRRRRP